MGQERTEDLKMKSHPEQIGLAMDKKQSESPQQNPLPDFEEIYQSHGQQILNLIFRMTGNEEVARDLTQDVFLKVYENLSSFRQESQIFTWIYRIATNITLNYLKRSRKNYWVSLLDTPLKDLLRGETTLPHPERESLSSFPESQMEKKEWEKIIWKLIQELPPKYRIPYVLHRYEGFSYKEIAEITSSSLSAVEARIHRAQKKLVEKLRPWVEEK
ncbi:MAG: sigma-70 family RNA polymerase sigma factor [Calditrichaeota bacterium]|nr:MAG: sigma-70 family RNA polymerase sigma factor [Calditrichota bacterium]